jgi:hypothetical protein
VFETVNLTVSLTDEFGGEEQGRAGNRGVSVLKQYHMTVKPRGGLENAGAAPRSQEPFQLSPVKIVGQACKIPGSIGKCEFYGIVTK